MKGPELISLLKLGIKSNQTNIFYLHVNNMVTYLYYYLVTKYILMNFSFHIRDITWISMLKHIYIYYLYLLNPGPNQKMPTKNS